MDIHASQTVNNEIGKTIKSVNKNDIWIRAHPVGQKKRWIVLLHGLGGDATAWDRECALLEAVGYSTLVMDLRGHGLSARKRDASYYGLNHFAEDVRVAMKAYAIEQAVVIGHCFGGMVAQALYLQYPHMLSGLILINSGPIPSFVYPISWFRKHAASLCTGIALIMPLWHRSGHVNFQRFVHTDDYDVFRLWSDITHTSISSYLFTLSTLLRSDFTDSLHTIAIPTQIIHGVKDRVIPVSVAELEKKSIKDARLFLISGGNHIVVLNNPKDMHSGIIQFLARLTWR